MSEHVAIVDCGSGNLRSVANALSRAAREIGADAHIDVTADPAAVSRADRVVLPGVGAFGAYMAGLGAIPGMGPALEHAALRAAKPFLGICVGMQALATRGLEFGETAGLGWVPGRVERFSDRPGRRIPHMGWNEVEILAPHTPFRCLEGEDLYFLHSYRFLPESDTSIAAVCQYGEQVVAAVARDNILGAQFHPEKSQRAGLAFLAAFLKWRP